MALNIVVSLNLAKDKVKGQFKLMMEHYKEISKMTRSMVQENSNGKMGKCMKVSLENLNSMEKVE